MSIVNATPDSFSDDGLYRGGSRLPTPGTGGQAKSPQKRLPPDLDVSQIIDIGGESTNPHSKPVNVEQELIRILPVIDIVRHQKNKDQIISLDTYKSPVAEAALQKGVEMINFLCGEFSAPDMYEVVAKYNAYLVIYHIFGTPAGILATRQKRQARHTDVITELLEFFTAQTRKALRAGIDPEKIIIDPGIGFGTTDQENVEILDRLPELAKLGYPILIGLSRKGFLGTLLQQKYQLDAKPEPQDRLEMALELTEKAVRGGAKVIRTHDSALTKKYLSDKGLM